MYMITAIAIKIVCKLGILVGSDLKHKLIFRPTCLRNNFSFIHVIVRLFMNAKNLCHFLLQRTKNNLKRCDSI